MILVQHLRALSQGRAGLVNFGQILSLNQSFPDLQALDGFVKLAL